MRAHGDPGPELLDRVRRAAADFDRASSAAARARRDLLEALEALSAPAAQDEFRPANPTRKMRALEPPKGKPEV